MINPLLIAFILDYIGFLLLFLWPVHAYVDPSVMTYAIQAVAGVLITLGTFIGVYWRKIRRYLFKYTSVDSAKNTESDCLEFHDPVLGKVLRVGKSSYTNLQLNAQDNKTTLTRDMVPAVYLAVAFGFLVGIYAPLEIYTTNIWDFWFDARIILPIISKVFVVATAAVLLILFVSRLLWINFYKIILGIGVILLICTYIQGSFLSSSLPLLDGTDINWTRYYSDMLVSVLLFAVITVIIVLMLRKMGLVFLDVITKGVSILILGTTILSLIIMLISTGGYKSKNYSFVTSENEFLMSENKNIVIFIIDCVDEKLFEETLYSEPEFLNRFEDFTLYTNVLCPYPYTSESIPYILNPVRITSGETLRDYHERSVNTSPVLQEMEKQGYLIDLYENSIIWDKVDISRFDNIYYEKPIVKYPRALTAALVKYTWFKYAPFYLKPLVYVSMDEINYAYDIDFNGSAEKFSDVNSVFFDQMKRTDVTTTEQNTFKFIHIEGAHAPFRYDRNVNVIDTSEGTYRKNIECSLMIASEYIDKLKRAGVYDDTALIFMSDHGFNPEINPETKRVRAVGRQHPILLIKGLNEKNSKLDTSDAPIAYEDLQGAYLKLLEGYDSDDVFDWQEGDQRDREYYFYDNTIRSDMEIQIFHGHVLDTDQIERTGIIIENVNR